MRHATSPSSLVRVLSVPAFAAALGVAGCSASVDISITGGAGGAGTGGAPGGAGGAAGGPVGGSGGSGNEIIFGGSGGTGGGSSNCNSGPNDDADGDGFTPSQGDCNDCDANMNPGAIEVLAQPDDMGNTPDPADEDCNGTIDDVVTDCDGNLATNDLDPFNAARAIDICKVATGGSWGVVEAAYVRADGSPANAGLAAGLLDTFGANVPPQKGARMLALSSGNARDNTNDGNACGALSCSNTGTGTPPGVQYCDPGAVPTQQGCSTCFPQDVSGCSGSCNINDDIALRLKLRTPTNANGLSYRFKFYSFEYPEWVCTSFNDQYVALMTPKPMGAVNSNISFDASNNPVSVNVAFFNANPNDLIGTGFDAWDDSGATDWLQTKAPIDGGTDIELLFAIWDTGDTAWDSTVLIDRFEWIADGGSVTVITEPPPPN
jgi:hypothetical protein